MKWWVFFAVALVAITVFGRRVTANSQLKVDAFPKSDDVRRALDAAREEAARLGSGYITPDHILLGLLKVNAASAVEILHAFGITNDALRSAVLAKQPKPGPSETATDLPYSGQAKNVLREAMGAATEMNDEQMGADHLLLGIARDASGPAAIVLGQMKADQVTVWGQLRAERLKKESPR